MAKHKIMFIGFDSASWNILSPMLSRGELPNLERLIKTGASCKTKAFNPLMSLVLWTSIATGKTPQKHGVKDFTANYKSLKCKPLWEILEENGHSVGLLGHMATWPPKNVDGFIIPDLFALGPETYPPELTRFRELILGEKTNSTLNLSKYISNGIWALCNGIRLSTLIDSALIIASDKIRKQDKNLKLFKLRELKNRFMSDFFIYNYKKYKPDFAFLHTHIVDTCSHFFWKYMEPDKFDAIDPKEIKKYGKLIFRAYKKVDYMIGRILKHLDTNTIVVIASDHGAKAISDTTDNRATFVTKSDLLFKYLGISRDINAFNLGRGIVFRTLGNDNASEKKVINLLSSLKICETGMKLFEIRKLAERYYQMLLNLELEAFTNLHVYLNNDKFKIADLIIISPDKISGDHDIENAVLIMNGPNIKRGLKISDNVSMLDITPTLLALINMPIAKDMDGNPIVDAIEDKFLKDHPIRYINTYEKERKKGAQEEVITEELKAQLRSLGYM